MNLKVYIIKNPQLEVLGIIDLDVVKQRTELLAYWNETADVVLSVSTKGMIIEKNKYESTIDIRQAIRAFYNFTASARDL